MVQVLRRSQVRQFLLAEQVRRVTHLRVRVLYRASGSHWMYNHVEVRVVPLVEEHLLG